MGKIFYIMGKSASGKDRIYSLLAAHKRIESENTYSVYNPPDQAGEQDGKKLLFL